MIKTIALCLSACFFCSFTLPPHTEFLKMSKAERESLIKETWDQRYKIMQEMGKPEDAKDEKNQTKIKAEFFDFFHQMLILDRDLERQTKPSKK